MLKLTGNFSSLVISNTLQQLFKVETKFVGNCCFIFLIYFIFSVSLQIFNGLTINKQISEVCSIAEYSDQYRWYARTVHWRSTEPCGTPYNTVFRLKLTLRTHNTHVGLPNYCFLQTQPTSTLAPSPNAALNSFWRSRNIPRLLGLGWLGSRVFLDEVRNGGK